MICYMNNKTLFIVNDGVYPFKTGGMEIFNYHLIRELKDRCALTYIATHKYDYTGLDFVKLPKMPLRRISIPLYTFCYILFHKNIRSAVISFSAAHWLMWYLYYLIIRLLCLKTIIVIHYGKNIPDNHVCIYKKLLKSAAHVVAVSEDIKRNYDDAFGIDCKVIYPLVPFEKSKKGKTECRKFYGIPCDARVFVMVGSLKEMKNPQTILEALTDMSEDEISALNPYVVYAGDGHMRDVIEKYVSDNLLTSRVRLLGNVPNDKVREIMMLADVYVIASDFEGTSVSLLEAMYNSKTIIASDVPGIRDMITDDFNGYMFKVGDYSDLKACMLKCKEDDEKLISLGVQAKIDFDRKYNHESMVDEYVGLIDRCV